MKRIILLSLLIFGIDSVAVAAAELSQEEKAKLAKQVKGIFEKKCAKCHGPKGVRETEKAKGDFDFVLDLEKLASDPDKIVRGNVNESKLFNMVEDEIRSDENSQDPLPEHDKKIIRRWILAGAPTEEGRQATTDYLCPATQKYQGQTVYTPEQLKKRQFSTRLNELPEGFFLDRCRFSVVDGKVTCDRQKVDRVELDPDLKIKKFYVFRSQINFQIFPNLSSLEDDGRGSVQFGQCEMVSH